MRSRHRRAVVAAVAGAALAFAGLPAVTGPAGAVPFLNCADLTWGGGDGTAATPYQVATADQLDQVRWCPTLNFVQTADISLAGRDWQPIPKGGSGAVFQGSYDGNNKTIAGLTITATSDVVGTGLFSQVAGTTDLLDGAAVIKNLTLTDVAITATIAQTVMSGQAGQVKYVGALAGFVGVGTTITGVTATGHGSGQGITINTYGDATSIGGLVGEMKGTASIERASAHVSVTVTAGFAGAIGGLAGLLNAETGSPTVSQSRALGSVTTVGSAQSYWTGGLIGRAGFGTLFAEATQDVASVINSYATGNVSGKASVGGLVGAQVLDGEFADVTTATVTNSYSTGAVSGVEASGVSGLVGLVSAPAASAESPGTVTSGYWDTQTSGQAATTCTTAAECGEGKTTEQMQTQATFVGWSFSSVKSDTAIWGMCQLGLRTYPFLWAFTATDPCPTVPGAPQNPAATPGDGQATATWSPPASDGGTPVTGYTVAPPTPTSARGGTRAGSPSCTTTGALTCTLTGLTNGTTYTLVVTATNAVGTGPASTAITVTPVAPTPPNPPTPPTVRQRPVRPLGLPTRVKNTGWTSLLDVPVVTNAGQEARVRVTCTPRVRGLAPAGDVVWCKVVRKAGKVRVWLSGTRAAVVRVVVSARAVEGYTAYRTVTVYRTTRVR